MDKWTKYPYGGKDGSGHWTITDGTTHFDIHPSYDGSGRKDKYPDGVIVSPERADAYAEEILAALNKSAEVTKAHNLLSYTWTDDHLTWHYACTVWEGDPASWVDSIQQYPETHILLNVLPISAEQAHKFDGSLKGM